MANLGEELGLPKIEFDDFDNFSEDMVKYLQGDLKTGVAIFRDQERFIFSPQWREALRTEHDAAWYMHIMHKNGFYFDKETCDELLDNIQKTLYSLDIEIQKAFPPRSKLVREITPSLTKHGTFNKKDFKWYNGTDYTQFSPGASFSLITFEPFNAGSPAQIVERLNEAGWKPFEKTKSHIQAERDRDQVKLQRFRKTGWKISEANLETLPPSAPEAAKSLARRILLASREGDLKEWLGAYREDTHRVHGTCLPIGAWTHRAAHRNPNTANIATGDSLYAHEFRGLWKVPDNRLLIGVDADGIQLRIFAHYCRDDRLVEAILRGNKKDKTDIHSLNQQGWGKVCKNRDDSKIGIYAFLLGAGDAKLATVFGCSVAEAKQARANILGFYPGLKALKEEQIPFDANRGYFEGFDGRLVLCDSAHLMLAGYLQNGEAIVMKKAKCIWIPEFEKRKFDYKLVNWVHDEWVTETAERLEIAAEMAKIQANAIAEVGELYKLYCPLSGAYLKEQNGEMVPSVGKTWYDVH